MKLKSLTLNGFKSFAEKTMIEFRPGLTAIVGPNGSGKSNLIEAIRWVLGEQSAKSLRGSKMPDVIFAGSTKQQALNRAEVELLLDNSDHFLPLESTEIAIDRRIYRNGESEYLLNGKNVRLKDITDLLLDTGLGRDSFSIISQGKVEQIFSSKPEERRQIIEEAAGILKYKQERTSAQNKLAETEDHLLRVADIISELATQREPLKEQASLAHDYLEQKNQLAFYDRSRLVYELEQATSQQTVSKQQQISAKKSVAACQQDKRLLAQKKDQLQFQQEKQLALIDQLQSELMQTVKQKERLIGQQHLSQQAADYQKQQKRELEQQIAAAKQAQTDLKQELNSLQQQSEIHSHNLMATQSQIKSFQQQLTLSANDLQDKVEELRGQIIDKMQQQASLNNQSHYLKKEIQRQDLQQAALTKKLAQLQQQQAAKSIANQQVTEQLASSQKSLHELSNGATDLQKQKTELEQKISDQREQWYQAAGIYQQTKAKYENLKELTQGYNNYYHGVKEILLAKKQLTGIIGSIAELLTVPEQLAPAIETVLASQLQNVVVSDEQAAKSAISFLKQHHYGRVTFLPQTSIKGRQLRPDLRQKLANLPGVIGIASNLVTISAANQAILEYLLGTTVIVKKIDDAIAVARSLNYSCRIVSLEGDVINASGAISGGSRRKTSGLLFQRQQLAKLITALKEMKVKLAKLEQTGVETKQQQQQVEKSVAAAQTAVAAKRDEVQKLSAKYQLIKNEEHHLIEQLAAQKFEVQQNNLANSNFAASQQQVAKQREQVAEELAELKQNFAASQAALANFSASRRKQEQKLAELQQQAAVSKAQEQNLQQQVTSLTARFAKLSTEVKTKMAALTELSQPQKLQQQQQLDLNLKQLVQKQHELEAKLLQEKQVRQQLQTQLTTVQANLNRQTELLQLQQQQLQQVDLKAQAITDQLDQNLTDLSQKYQLTFEAAQQMKRETDFKVIQRQLKLLQRGIRELGNVNLGAIDEYQRVDQRYQFLETQKADLLKAKAQLQESMAEIDQQVKQRFNKTFTQTAAAFAKIFPEMFGGGQASLKLTDPADLLQTGVEIMAQPPGKKLQRLSLLSGGEKALTAIVLLFAILKVRPVPFVILDEAEAALDDANVERYSKYLKRFCQQTQFIVITHRKVTMDYADVLYGVTMQKSGISKMVSVALT
ncbi:chromosome segregation protein SMC [Liquorilactobacillus sicerae]|uniref:chromosome segregation protein SMC n=1 Tax=Liquorilactobacillus sicerae TaxID=1416943 RepID=UPI0024814EB0|nr:chromosome segregation protein SMC [Liquorilactobacillus sicerae]